MTVRQPIALENASAGERPNADEFRSMIQHLGAAATRLGASAVHGVTELTGLAVTEKSGTPNMSVDVAAGAAFIDNTQAASWGGTYFVVNDATVNLVVPTADATNPRKDLVILRVRDSFHSGTDDDAGLVYVAGTPAASPAEPNLAALGYANYVVLALVDVPASDTSITNAQITDRRTFSCAPLAVAATRTTTLSLTTAIWTAITLPTETRDNGGWFTASNAYITAPRTGWVHYDAMVEFASNGTGLRALGAYIGAAYPGGGAGPTHDLVTINTGSALAYRITGGDTVYLTAGDRITLLAQQSSGGALNVSLARLAAHYVG